MINIFKKLKNKYTPAEYFDLLIDSKNILIEEDDHRERLSVVSRIEKTAIMHNIDIIYMKDIYYVSVEYVEEGIRYYDYRAMLNPSYDDIKTITGSVCPRKEGNTDEGVEDGERDNRNVFIVFDNAKNNYFETIEYASIIAENLLDKGRNVLLIIDGFENFRKEKDLNFVSDEYYDFYIKY